MHGRPRWSLRRPPGADGASDRSPSLFFARASYALTPCVIGIPIVFSLLVDVVHLLSLSHPDLGSAGPIANDAKAIASGHAIYADPADHYSGMLYGPVYPLMLSALYSLSWWDGWTPTVSTIAGLALMAGIGTVVLRPIRAGEHAKTAAAVGALGMAGFVWWMISGIPGSSMSGGRPDYVAWAFAFLGLGWLARVVEHVKPRTWPVVMLLTAAVWTKQTTVGASAAAIVVMTGWMLVGSVSTSAWRRFSLQLVALNVGVLAFAWVATDGWVWHFLVELPMRHGHDPAIAKYLDEMRVLFTPLAIMLAVPLLFLVTSTSLAARVRESWRSRSLPFALALGVLLAATLIFSLPPTWLARRKQGGDANNYLGLMWAVGLLIGLVYRECRRSARSMAVAAATCGVLSIGAIIPVLQPTMLDVGIATPAVRPRAELSNLPPALVRYARTHEVYVPDRGLVTVARPKDMWPSTANVIDLLAAGDTPDYLLAALIERRFDAVEHFDERWDAYASGYGRHRSGYLALLNLIIDHGYVEGANGAPPPLLGRRPGRLDLTWLSRCASTGVPAEDCQHPTAGEP